MKANELRIGITVEHKGIHMDIWAIWNNSNPDKESYYVDLDSKEHDIHLKGIEIEQVKGIRLTDEWFNKLGGFLFRDGEVIHGRFRLKYLSGHEYWYVTDKETGSYITKVEFVHEWQNIVHAINGQELKQK